MAFWPLAALVAREVAIELLKAQGWWQQNLDFVIPDGPHVVEADADPEQLQRVGLTQLVASKKYRPGAAYKEWWGFFGLNFGKKESNHQNMLRQIARSGPPTSRCSSTSTWATCPKQRLRERQKPKADATARPFITSKRRVCVEIVETWAWF